MPTSVKSNGEPADYGITRVLMHGSKLFSVNSQFWGIQEGADPEAYELVWGGKYVRLVMFGSAVRLVDRELAEALADEVKARQVFCREEEGEEVGWWLDPSLLLSSVAMSVPDPESSKVTVSQLSGINILNGVANTQKEQEGNVRICFLHELLEDTDEPEAFREKVRELSEKLSIFPDEFGVLVGYNTNLIGKGMRLCHYRPNPVVAASESSSSSDDCFGEHPNSDEEWNEPSQTVGTSSGSTKRKRETKSGASSRKRPLRTTTPLSKEARELQQLSDYNAPGRLERDLRPGKLEVSVMSVLSFADDMVRRDQAFLSELLETSHTRSSSAQDHLLKELERINKEQERFGLLLVATMNRLTKAMNGYREVGATFADLGAKSSSDGGPKPHEPGDWPPPGLESIFPKVTH